MEKQPALANIQELIRTGALDPGAVSKAADLLATLAPNEIAAMVALLLDACQPALQAGAAKPAALPYFVHASAFADEGAEIGEGTRIWHFAHVMKGARIGRKCVIGQNVNVDGGAVVGNNVKIQNNVSVYTGIVIEDDVFLGPSCVLTNVDGAATARRLAGERKAYLSAVL